MSQTILSISNARNNDFDYTLTYGNIIYKNKEIQNVSIDDIVGSFVFEEQLLLDNALSLLYNHNDSYGERNLDKLNNDIYTNLNNIKKSNEFIDLIKIGDKYYVGQDGNHRVFYLINEYNKLKEQFKNDPDKLSEIKKMFEIKCRVTKKLEFESINKICYALNKCSIDDIKISFPTDKEVICQVEYSGNIYLVKSEEDFLDFFKSYYESIEKGSDKYDKLTSALSNTGILNVSESIIKHPKSDELNELEKQKQIAKQNNDDVAYNYAQQCIIKIIRENRMQVSPEQWDSFTKQQKESYIQIKMGEAKVLNDKDEFNYWNANLNSLNVKLISQSEVKSYNQPSYNSASVSSITKSNYKEQEMKDYKYYYQELMKAVERKNKLVNPTEAERKQIAGEIFYNQGFLVESLNTQQEFNEVMNSLVNDLNDNQLQKIILSDMQDKYNSLFKNNSNSLDEQRQVKTATQEQTKLTIFVDQLREKMNKVNAEYKFMLLDGYIDDVELEVLISRTNELIDNANSLKPLANNQNEVMLLNSIAEMLHSEQKKMITMQKGIEKIEETRRTL